ncbi:MAG: polysaccharide deacetylase family protein [Mesorhizobium sp.]|nr:polysaccharide deacetylase family protein [Mesorhizobium sp.]MBL8576295.1 polysaccharide deacetylase family protein [Mesorhizobium sp.]
MIDGGEVFRKLALNVARYSGLASISRPLVGGIGAILMLHRVTAKPEKPFGLNRHLSIEPDFLDALVGDLKGNGYAFVSMDEAVARIKSGGAGGRFAAITADDAYRDNLTEALPVLERHGAPLTIYVAPALIDGSADLWWDVVEDIVDTGVSLQLAKPNGTEILYCSNPGALARLCDHLTSEVPEEEQRQTLRKFAALAGVDPGAPGRKTLMNWDEIRAAAAHPLVTIGSHTINHYNLKRLPEAVARREITDVVARLRGELGKAPRHLAYPYGFAGAVGRREVGLAREAGYLSAVTTRHGVLRAGHARHLLALPRISINGRYQSVAHVRTMLSGITTPLANRGKMVVTV